MDENNNEKGIFREFYESLNEEEKKSWVDEIYERMGIPQILLEKVREEIENEGENLNGS